MKALRGRRFLMPLLLFTFISGCTVIPEADAQTKPAELRVANSPFPVRVLIQSPAESETELQIICLFESVPANTLHGSLLELDEKLKGLLVAVRKPDLFRGELGETILITRPGAATARRLLIIGLGSSDSFTPRRMELVGSIAYHESNRLGVRHPFFAPAVLDGGVTTANPGETAEQFFRGFLRAERTEKLLVDAGSSTGQVIQDITFLAGPTHAIDTQRALERASTNSAH
jgi:hypothetical protein